jgi:hypothetical protein
VSAGAPAGLRIRGVPAQIGRVEPFAALRVEIVDADGYLVTTASDSVTLELGANPNIGALAGQTRAQAVDGVATFSPLAVTRAGPSYTLVASSGALAPDTSSAFDVGGVAVFGNNAYVDWIVGSPNSEASNLYDSYRTLGLDVHAFSSLDFVSDLADAWVLAIPELFSDVAAVMTATQRAAVVNFVNNGGTLVVQGGAQGVVFLNTLFAYGLVSGVTGGPYALSGAAVGTVFETGPASLVAANGTYPWTVASLPVGSLVMYGAGPDATVAVIPRNNGQIILMGWDWFNAQPIGNELGGLDWLNVLYRATRY